MARVSASRAAPATSAGAVAVGAGNEKLARLRAVITRESAVLAFDLAADKQVCAATDQDSRALARRTGRCKAGELSDAVSWGLARAAEAGFTRVVVACEPTGHTELDSSIPGVSAIGAATILAESGDSTRFTSARALVKHAGLCPRDNTSGAYQGKTDTQARVAITASLLRQLHAVVVIGTAWDPAIAAGLDRREDGAATAACPSCAAEHRAGRARIAVGTPITRLTTSSPARLPPSPDEGCREQPA